jgi:hypothetical protein
LLILIWFASQILSFFSPLSFHNEPFRLIRHQPKQKREEKETTFGSFST